MIDKSNKLALLILWGVFVVTIVVHGREALIRAWVEHRMAFDDFAMYFDVRPLNQEMRRTSVAFVSDRETYRDVRMWWRDVVYCRPWGSSRTFRRKASYESGGQVVEAHGRQVFEWAWPAASLPDYDAECYAAFEITIRPHGIEKVQKLTSATFRVTPES